MRGEAVVWDFNWPHANRHVRLRESELTVPCWDVGMLRFWWLVWWGGVWWGGVMGEVMGEVMGKVMRRGDEGVGRHSPFIGDLWSKQPRRTYLWGRNMRY